MIPLPGIRDKGAGPQLGAHPGEQGPFGVRTAKPEPDEDDLDDEQPSSSSGAGSDH